MKRRRFLERAAIISAAQFITPFNTKNFYSSEAKMTSKNITDSKKAELLYNGIQLPNIWPPQNLNPESNEPMSVPYLKQPPEVIPINIGRQLFVDDFLVQETDLKRTYYQAEKYYDNPVFKPETIEELDKNSVVYLGHGGVFYDNIDHVFKMYYTAGWRGGLALATSNDMIHWNRPKGLIKENLILPVGAEWEGHSLKTAGTDNSLWLDINAENSNERIKFLTCWMHVPAKQRPEGFNHTLHTSSDGVKWSAAVPTGSASDYCSFFYNPFRKVWVFSIKRGGPRGRCRYYSENADFIKGADWSNSVYWTNADSLDLPEPEGRYPGAGETPQLYSLNAVAYESLMVGVHYIHRGPSNKICEEGRFPKLTDLEIGFSRDGFHWDRPDRRGFILGTRKEDSWDRAYIHSTTGVFVVHGDKLVFPYTGFSGLAFDGSRGMYNGGSVGLAMLRRDGFASFDAGNKNGTLTTRPVEFNGFHLFVNVECPKGELRVEILDGSNNVLESFSAKNCKAIKADNTCKIVEWVGVNDLSTIRERPVKFRFHLKNGKLFAFWVSPNKSGASNGYLGAGSHDYKGIIDKTGNIY